MPRQHLFKLAVRMVWTEARHSAFVWAIPLLAVLFVFDPFHTASAYPALWTLRSSVVLDKFWPVYVPFAAAFCAWAGSREGRRGVGDLLNSTARPAWTRQLCSLAGTLAWVLAVFGAGVAALYLYIAQTATWGGPPIWPVAAGAVSLTAVCALTFTLGALFPGRFTTPIVAVGISVLVLVAFSRAVSQGGVSVASLSPDGSVPGNDAGVFYPVAPDVSIVQVVFFAGATLGAVGLLGLSPRTGGAGWRGALDLASGGGARLRTVATGVFAAGIALAVIGFGLAATARVSSVTGGIEVPALDGSASDKPVPYTPVCASVTVGGFLVCVHPAFKSYLGQAVNSFGPVMAELSGLPGAPVRAVEVSGLSLPSVVQQVYGNGVVTGSPPVYSFSMNGAITQVPDSAQFRDGFRQDIVHAVIVGPVGQMTADGAFQPDTGTPAQQAVEDGLLKAIGSQPYPLCPQGDYSSAQHCTPQAQVTAAAARFAALPDATRHAWLAANLAALKAGRLTPAGIP
ncbi:MAG TPA: hypothetical protein VHT26_24780 [Trebonia sp.]|jgi:hypothetical protein|nr:hypothetical protein [Trebonia sp.]